MDNDTVGRAKVRQIITLFGKAGIKDRAKRIYWMQVWTGRTERATDKWALYSTTDLTEDEADLVIGEIKALLEDDGFPVPPRPQGVV